MKRIALAALFAATLHAQATIDGDWIGALEVPGAKLRLAIHLKSSPTGLTGTMDSLDQGAMGLPMTTATFANGVLDFALKVVGGTYQGKLSADGKEIAGTWSQGQPMPLTFKRSDKPIEPPKRPQELKPPFPYDSEEVSIDSVEGVKLAGTLTLPKGEGKFAAAILISGSGPQNRDEELMGHKPFAVLADHLTHKGIAVLRYDDRGFAKSTGRFNTSTTVDFADDVAAVVTFLKKHPRINDAKIGLIGHSEGGLVAPLVAAKDPTVAFIVLIAGPGVTGEQILYAQGAAILKAGNMSQAMIDNQRAMQEQLFAIVKAEPDPEKRIAKLKEAAAAMGPAGESQARAVSSPWFRYFLLHDPAPVLEKVKCPVLAVNGALDVQVPVDQNLPAIAKALAKGGNKQVETLSLPNLNHLLQTAKTGSPAEYMQIEETMSPVALNAISDWVVARTKPSEPQP